MATPETGVISAKALKVVSSLAGVHHRVQVGVGRYSDNSALDLPKWLVMPLGEFASGYSQQLTLCQFVKITRWPKDSTRAT